MSEEIIKGIVEGLSSDSDEKRAQDLKAACNFLNKAGVALSQENGLINPVYARGVNRVKAIQREYFNQIFSDEE